MIAGITAGRRHGAAAFADQGRLVGVLSQERVTRSRAAGTNDTGMPDEAIDLMLERLGRTRRDISRRVRATIDWDRTAAPVDEHIEHDFAHACTSYLTSKFESAAIVVCDHDVPGMRVFKGSGSTVVPVDWPAAAAGFAEAYSRFARAFGFTTARGDQQFEALARLGPGRRISKVDGLLSLVDSNLQISPSFESTLEDLLRGSERGSPVQAEIASALQERLGELLVECLRDIGSRLRTSDLCLGGSLFHHSSINTIVKKSGVFTGVSIPVDPGNSGLAVGAACHGAGMGPLGASPFLGPAYTSEEIKQTLDNCKLQYDWQTEDHLIGEAVTALQRGYLVGWFDGPMEWGQRALGARCILANPMAPYVLDNLNRFLKRREPWRGYALSGLEESVADHFEGPDSAPLMQYDYRARDAARLRVLPVEGAALRVHTVAADGGRPRFRRLLAAFGDATGLPFLVNTSFNGFHEPIVCSPRDAVRVFYGTGLDVLICDQFVLRK